MISKEQVEQCLKDKYGHHLLDVIFERNLSGIQFPVL